MFPTTMFSLFLFLFLFFYFHPSAIPPAPSSSCTLTEGTGNTTQLILMWTEPAGDGSIDQYCINSSPEYPSASSLCVGSNVSIHEYQVQEGLQYNFTLFAVNCEDQNGTETAPISVFPQGMYHVHPHMFLHLKCLQVKEVHLYAVYVCVLGGVRGLLEYAPSTIEQVENVM